MLKAGINNKGIALFMVLAAVLIVVALANVALTIISSQGRLTQHEIGRIQAYYAAQAGMVYALEQLRNGNWTYSPNTCPDTTPCQVIDSGFSPYIVNNRASVIFCPSASTCNLPSGSTITCTTYAAGITFCVHSYVEYTYTP